MPDAWLKGPVPDVPPALQPVAHAFLNARFELDGVLAPDVTEAMLRARPAGVASTAFHIRHLCGSADRLLTYARDESLDETQLATLEKEKSDDAPADPSYLRQLVERTFRAALEQLKATRVETLDEARGVGRKRLPSTVRGLLFHAAEHAARHTGQAVTTMRIVRGG